MIVLGLAVGMVLTFSLGKRPGTLPPPPPGAAQSNLPVVHWELGWVGVCRELTLLLLSPV